MNELVKNVIVTALILFVVRLITVGIARNIEQEKIDEEEAKLSKKERKNLNNPYLTGKIIIEYGKGIKALMIFAFIFFGALTMLNIGIYYWNWAINNSVTEVTVIGFSLFTLLCAAGVGGTVLWRITLEGDNIEYSDYLGIKHHYKWDEISKVLICAKKIKVYKGNRVIFTVDDNVPEGDYLIGIAKERNIPVELDDSFKKYCDKNGIKYQ